MRIWDIANKCRIKAFHGHSDVVLDIAVDQDKNALITTSLDGTMRFWSLISYKCERVARVTFTTATSLTL